MSGYTNPQLAHLSILAYLDPPPDLVQGGTWTVGDIATYYSQNPGAVRRDCAGMTESEWQNEMNLILSDEALSSLEMAGHTSPQENDASGLFAYHFERPGGGDPLVAFRGSEGSQNDWGDNFRLEAADGDGTLQQRKALEYLESLGVDGLTVTGHSKGGNNAEFVTVMSDKVERCVSFDAPGVSKEFIDANAGRIDANQDKITSISADTDYVNVLLHGIAGKRIYLECGEFDKLAHAPNRLLDDQGNLRPAGSQYAYASLLGGLTRGIGRLLPNDVSPYVVEFILDMAFRGKNAMLIRFAQQPGVVILVGLVAIGALIVGARVYGIEFVAREIMDFVEWAIGEAERLITKAAAFLSAMLGAVLAARASIIAAVKSYLAKLSSMLRGGGARGGYAYGEIRVDCNHMRSLGMRLRSVQSRIASVDRRLNRLLWAIDAQLKPAVMGLDWSVGYDVALSRCTSYLDSTAQRFDVCEAAVHGRAARFRG